MDLKTIFSNGKIALNRHVYNFKTYFPHSKLQSGSNYGYFLDVKSHIINLLLGQLGQ